MGGVAKSHWTVNERRALALLLSFCFTLRLAFGVLLPSIHWPDEVFQATEQAHRLLTGEGVVPWEWRAGARNWIWPGLLAIVLWPVVTLFGFGEPEFYAVLVVCVALSLIGVAAAFAIGRRASFAHAVLAGFTVAVWPELVYFSMRPLTEAVAASLLLAAIAYATSALNARRLFIVGALLSICFIFRFHILLALGAVALYALWKSRRTDWLSLFAGASAPLLTFALVDWATWGAPFHSVFANAAANLEFPDRFGVAPLYFYAKEMVFAWGGALPVIGALALVGARRQPLLLVAAILIVLTHSIIPHKEFRFIVPAVACIATLAGLGAGDLAQAFATRRPAFARWSAPAAALLLLSMSVCMAALNQARAGGWTRGRQALAAFWHVGRQSDLCGLGLIGLGIYDTPGQSALAKPAALYVDAIAPARAELTGAYNYLAAPQSTPVPDEFQRTACFEEPFHEPLCVLRRPGDCAPARDSAINAYLVAHGY